MKYPMTASLESPYTTNGVAPVKKEDVSSWALVPFYTENLVQKPIMACNALHNKKQIRCILPSESSRSKRNVSMYVKSPN